jgi:hypothetical protein
LRLAQERGQPSVITCSKASLMTLLRSIPATNGNTAATSIGAGRLSRASAASGSARLCAVQAAIIQPWSNGQTEGQITKLKLVKRQMYGRAKLDLLEARLIGAA